MSGPYTFGRYWPKTDMESNGGLVPAPPAPPPRPVVKRDGRGRFTPGGGRPPRRRGGGRPGNVSAAKPQNIPRLLWRRGLAAVRALVQAGKLPADALAVLAQAPAYEAAALVHVGEATFVEQRAVSNAALAATIAQLCRQQALSEGVFAKDPKAPDGPSRLHPLLVEAGRFLEIENKALAQLPKERRVKQARIAELMSAGPRGPVLTAGETPEEGQAQQAPRHGAIASATRDQAGDVSIVPQTGEEEG